MADICLTCIRNFNCWLGFSDLVIVWIGVSGFSVIVWLGVCGLQLGLSDSVYCSSVGGPDQASSFIPLAELRGHMEDLEYYLSLSEFL